MGFPIIDQGVVVGCLSTGVSTEREDRLQGMADELADALGNIVNNTESIARGATELAAASQQINGSAQQVRSK
ncbi:hypothetical protein MXD81_20100, partial [Microbacteriaceae bacterium K1510]|nr:hypothetical protein [Microbacteriaceae bacterium K1510]